MRRNHDGHRENNFWVEILEKYRTEKTTLKSEHVPDYIVKMIHDFFSFVYTNSKVSSSRVKK